MTSRKSNPLVGERVAIFLIIVAALAIGSCASNSSSGQIQRTQVKETTPAIAVDYAWLDSVHFELYQCSRTLAAGGSYTFYLVGEFHAYNEPTSRFADTLLARLQPGLFISEGADSTQPRSELMKNYSSTMKGLFSEIGYDQPELSRLAMVRNIPVLWLEQIDTATGVYAGVTESEAEGLETMVGALVEGSPM
ncbi:MAG: hypothetical protein WBP29_08375 [Candidatus Zixiibacteriota bacterium]